METDNPYNDSVFCYFKKLFIKIWCLLLQILYHDPLLSESSCVPSAKSTVFHMFYSSSYPAMVNYICKWYLLGTWGFIFLLPEELCFALQDSVSCAQLLLSCSHRAVQA